MGTVLVLDEVAVIRDALCRVLRQQGHDPVPAADAGEAVVRLADRPPDVVLVDVNPDGPGGSMALDAVCREPRWWAVPVVLLTSEADARGLYCHGHRRAGRVQAVTSLRQAVERVGACAAAGGRQ